MSAPSGVQFPADPSGRRSTTETSKTLLSAALEATHPEAARAVREERNWRQRYPVHLRAMLEHSLARPRDTVAIARAGLDAARRELEFLRDGRKLTLDEATASPSAPGLRTVEVTGVDRSAPARWEVPYKGRQLSGDALLAQLDDWVKRGVMEVSAAEALRLVQRNPDWLDLSDRTQVLLGAASEAGPLAWLLRWRANVVAVDLKRPDIWEKIVAWTRAGNGRLLAPLPAARSSAGDGDFASWRSEVGCDLLTDTPEIAAWLSAMEGPLDIASLAYLDGERHLRVTMAMDSIVTRVSCVKPGTSLAYMATPTDLFAVPEEVAHGVMDEYARRSVGKRLGQAVARGGSGGRLFQPGIERLIQSEEGRSYGIVDCLILQQGPSYALAKRAQQWRALVARADGQTVSLNVAPSTATRSVVKNPALAAGFRGAHAFGVEVFEPATTNALMAAMWVHDLRNPKSSAYPDTPLRHPLELLMQGANHGGMWRIPYTPRSVLPFAALLGLVRR
ncbi:MAG TPA: hypothetical protein VE153_14855 [Myxococcus sp.]|nr:hypothetical protein [Myxococcus sp.]